MLASLSRDMKTGKTYLVDLKTNERKEYNSLIEAWDALEAAKRSRLN